MHIAIRATIVQQKELAEKGFPANARVQWLTPGDSFTGVDADAFFDFNFNDTAPEANEVIPGKPCFVHAVACTGLQIKRPNYIRLNAWPGFLNRPVVELACNNAATRQKAEMIFSMLNWQFIWVADDLGLVAARIIAMIINEAYFALAENVSTKTQIDIAMRLGTNYPYGPFEWGEKIGLQHICNLLKQLEQKDNRYAAAALLLYESQQSN